jgi:hypothetical protein
MVLASLQLKPAAYLAASVHPPNFPVNAVTIIAMVNPKVIPSSNRPRSVESPESVKYCKTSEKGCHQAISNAYQGQEDDGDHIL